MTLSDIAIHRLQNQQLLGAKIKTPKEMVQHFGAMQAQDYAMSKWAVGIRMGATERRVEEAINNAEIFRIHALRPTWHLVGADDIRWMLALAGPQVKRLCSTMCRQYGMDDKTLNRFYKTIAKALEGGNHLTREELVKALKLKGAMANDIRPSLVMMNAEQEAIVCNGPMRGKQYTYALLDERAPSSKAIGKEEALSKLAKRYFISHGPATIHDFIWWSGLSVANSKLALDLVKSDLCPAEVDGKVYWSANSFSGLENDADTIHLLPAFDEFLISYKDRTASIHPDRQPIAFTRNGIFKPIIVVNGQVAGIWKRSLNKDTATIEAALFEPLKKARLKDIAMSAEQYGVHTERKVIFNYNSSKP